MANKENLQDQFLEEVRRTRTQVTVFLMNGFQIRGTIQSFDSFAILLASEGKQNMIYKHAVSTITPFSPVRLARQEP